MTQTSGDNRSAEPGKLDHTRVRVEYYPQGYATEAEFCEAVKRVTVVGKDCPLNRCELEEAIPDLLRVFPNLEKVYTGVQAFQDILDKQGIEGTCFVRNEGAIAPELCLRLMWLMDTDVVVRLPVGGAMSFVEWTMAGEGNLPRAVIPQHHFLSGVFNPMEPSDVVASSPGKAAHSVALGDDVSIEGDMELRKRRGFRFFGIRWNHE